MNIGHHHHWIDSSLNAATLAINDDTPADATLVIDICLLTSTFQPLGGFHG